MKLKQASTLTGLSKNMLRHCANAGVIKESAGVFPELRAYGDADVDRLKTAAVLFKARFSSAQAAKMLDAPASVPEVTGAHIAELRENGMPGLADALEKAASARNARALGEAFVEAYVLSDGDRARLRAAERLCWAALERLEKIKRRCRAADAVDLFGMIPVVGAPFGAARSAMLSGAGKKLAEARAECGALFTLLGEVELNADLETDGLPALKSAGACGDYMSPIASTGNYLTEVFAELDGLVDRINSVLLQIHICCGEQGA